MWEGHPKLVRSIGLCDQLGPSPLSLLGDRYSCPLAWEFTLDSTVAGLLGSGSWAIQSTAVDQNEILTSPLLLSP